MDVHLSDSLERRVVIRTPENLELSFDLAGAGTRSAAYAVDLVVMSLSLSMLQNLFGAILIPLSDEMQGYGFAVIALLSFAFINLYFILFELLWGGQTPGKRLVGIRVVTTGGFALGFVDSLLRNLLRALDFLPLFYGVGLCSLLLTRCCQRLGDLVAGTIVVYQASREPARALPTVRPAEADQLSVVQVASIPAEIVETCDEFLRALPVLAPRFRQEYAGAMLDLIEKTSGLAPAATQSPEGFMAAIISRAERSPAES